MQGTVTNEDLMQFETLRATLDAQGLGLRLTVCRRLGAATDHRLPRFRKSTIGTKAAIGRIHYISRSPYRPCLRR